jgi:hypothetical protein
MISIKQCAQENSRDGARRECLGFYRLSQNAFKANISFVVSARFNLVV